MTFAAPWPVVPLEEVAETALGKMLDSGRPKGAVETPYLRNLNVQWGRIDTTDVATVALSEEERARFAVHPGDLLVCEGGAIGRAAIWHGPAEIGYQKALHRVRSRGDLDLRWLRYLLEQYDNQGVLAARATGSTIKHLPQTQLRQLPVPLPELSEQRRIVDVLEHHLSRLEAATAGVEQVWRQLDTLRLARASSALFGKNYLTQPLQEILEATIGGVWGSAPGEDDHDVAVLRVTELKAHGVIEPATAAVRSITASQLKSRELRPGDLLLEKSGGGPVRPVGRVGMPQLVEPGSVCSNFMQLLRPAPGAVDSRYLFWFLHCFYLRGGTESMQTASTNIRNLKMREYLAMPVPLPSFTEQRRIATNLDETLHATVRIGQELSAAGRRSAALRRSLLDAAFAGRL